MRSSWSPWLILCALLGALLCSSVARVHAEEATAAAAISGNEHEVVKLNTAGKPSSSAYPASVPRALAPSSRCARDSRASRTSNNCCA